MTVLALSFLRILYDSHLQCNQDAQMGEEEREKEKRPGNKRQKEDEQRVRVTGGAREKRRQRKGKKNTLKQLLFTGGECCTSSDSLSHCYCDNSHHLHRQLTCQRD